MRVAQFDMIAGLSCCTPQVTGESGGAGGREVGTRAYRQGCDDAVQVR